MHQKESENYKQVKIDGFLISDFRQETDLLIAFKLNQVQYVRAENKKNSALLDNLHL